MNAAPERQRMREGAIFLVLFALTIPAANWLIGHVGTACVAPRGPCLVPVAPGVMAPSGVMMVGIALVLRDLVQRRLGAGLSALAILVMAPDCRLLVAPPALIVASAILPSLLSWSSPTLLRVYTPPRAAAAERCGGRRFSSCAGLVVDSIVFLWLAFGSLEFLPGQIIGKAWMVLLSIPFVAWLRRRDERLGMKPA